MSNTVVAAQLFGWTQAINFPDVPPLLERLDEAFAAIKRAGFDHVEHGVEMAASETFLAALERHGLGFPAAYSGGTFHVEADAEASIERTVAAGETARQVGVTVVNCNPSPKEGGDEKTDAELALQATMLDRCGAALADLGVRFALHNHTPAMRSDGREVHANLRNTDPAHVWLNADVEWIRHGGGDPVAFLEEYGDRTASLHLRDAAATQWVQALGEGDMDLEAIAEVLRRKGFAGPISLELATDPRTVVTRSFEANHRRSRAVIRRVFGV
ncbi:MAG: sugar phosphate isomerase/epimerase family protein [Planctomycetota bacterium]